MYYEQVHFFFVWITNITSSARKEVVSWPENILSKRYIYTEITKSCVCCVVYQYFAWGKIIWLDIYMAYIVYMVSWVLPLYDIPTSLAKFVHWTYLILRRDGNILFFSRKLAFGVVLFFSTFLTPRRKKHEQNFSYIYVWIYCSLLFPVLNK